MKILAVTFFAMVILAARLHAQIVEFEGRDFRKADSVAALYPGYSLRDLKSLADKLTNSLSSEEEKFRAIYGWVCLNVSNDYRFFLKNKRKRDKLKNDQEGLKNWNRKFSELVFHRLLTDHKTICTGYAYLVKELASKAGFSCVIIDGYGRTARSNIGGTGIANHTWNAIQLNDHWYLCDATWSSGAMDSQTGKFVKQFNASYFLADPSWFIGNHYPLDTAWMLLKEKPSLREFLDGPLIYSNAYRYKIRPVFPETFNVAVTRGDIVSFRFRKDSDAIVNKMELSVVRQNALEGRSSEMFFRNSDGLYCSEHLFAEKGIHVVHVLMDSSYAFSYTVNVR